MALAGHSNDPNSAFDALEDAGVEVLAPIDAGDELLGAVLLGPTGDPYSDTELDFVATVAAQIAVALRWYRVADQLRDTERVATRGYLAASFAHDLGKPIEVAWGIARSLLYRSDLTAETRVGLEQIQDRADQALSIVDQLLAPRGEHSNRRAVGDVLSSVIEEVRSRFPHSIRPSLAPDLPDIDASIELHQVLVNVLENACLASEPSDSIEVFGRLGKQRVVLEVVDQGCGMDPKTASQAFDLWFTTRAAVGGRGLGLGLCRSMLSQIGGEIEIASTSAGWGTSIRVTLETDR